MNNELLEKMKAMSVEDLENYGRTAKITSMFLNVFSVAIIFGMLVLGGFILVTCGSILIYFAAHLSIGVNNTREVIKDLLSKASDK